MRKSFIALCVAAALTAPMIAQADANLLMQAPSLFFQLETDQQPVVTMIATAETVAVDRFTMSQPEAVAVLADKSGESVGLVKQPINGATLVTGPFEVGWRPSA